MIHSIPQNATINLGSLPLLLGLNLHTPKLPKLTKNVNLVFPTLIFLAPALTTSNPYQFLTNASPKVPTYIPSQWSNGGIIRGVVRPGSNCLRWGATNTGSGNKFSGRGAV